MSAAGKGHAPRPLSVPADEYASNWDRIFGKKDDTKCPRCGGKGCVACDARLVPQELPKQEPVAWQFFAEDRWWNGDDHPDRSKAHRKNTEAAGYPVRDLYAAPPQRQPLNWEPLRELWRKEQIDWDALEAAVKAAHGIGGDQ